ncbi:MAG: hypothetical protein ACOCXH_07825 [Cyclobacteriaceae bacterium]
MDESIIFYIIFAVIFIISRLLKGKRQPDGQGPNQEDGRPQRRPMSIEDILRELSGEEAVAEKEEYKPVPEKPRSREVVEEIEQKTERKYEQWDDEVKTTYERSVSAAKNLKTIDQLVDYEQPREKILKEEQVTTNKASGAAKIARMLKNKSEARKAIILSEIIQNKYI